MLHFIHFLSVCDNPPFFWLSSPISWIWLDFLIVGLLNLSRSSFPAASEPQCLKYVLKAREYGTFSMYCCILLTKRHNRGNFSFHFVRLHPARLRSVQNFVWLWGFFTKHVYVTFDFSFYGF